MKKKIIITGGSGMVGSILLQLCLKSNEVSEVISLVRKSTQLKNDKYREVMINDFLNYENYSQLFNDVDIVFYCLGAYTGLVSPIEFRKINYDYPLSLAKSIHKITPNATFCLLSGQGADRTEKSNIQFASDKGAIENALSSLDFKSFYSFRPGYIYPTKKRKEPNFFYKVFRFIYPLIKLLGKKASITDQQLAEAMFITGMNGYSKEVLENKDMRQLFIHSKNH